jgi:hypothetical protein
VQTDLNRFSSSILNLTVNATNVGIVKYKGITFNWMTRMLVVCGGQQVNFYFHLRRKIYKLWLLDYNKSDKS